MRSDQDQGLRGDGQRDGGDVIKVRSDLGAVADSLLEGVIRR